MFDTLFGSPAVRLAPLAFPRFNFEPTGARFLSRAPAQQLRAQPKLGIIPTVQIGIPSGGS
jgi:hypothetical protein